MEKSRSAETDRINTIKREKFTWRALLSKIRIWEWHFRAPSITAIIFPLTESSANKRMKSMCRWTLGCYKGASRPPICLWRNPGLSDQSSGHLPQVTATEELFASSSIKCSFCLLSEIGIHQRKWLHAKLTVSLRETIWFQEKRNSMTVLRGQ